jgi:cytochrome c biogenesis protein CcdA
LRTTITPRSFDFRNAMKSDGSTFACVYAPCSGAALGAIAVFGGVARA